MAYIYLNKETKELRVFGSIEKLSTETGIKPDNLYTHFSRKRDEKGERLKEFENDNYRIVKTKIERS